VQFRYCCWAEPEASAAAMSCSFGQGMRLCGGKQQSHCWGHRCGHSHMAIIRVPAEQVAVAVHERLEHLVHQKQTDRVCESIN
jgi:hypothetical protein